MPIDPQAKAVADRLGAGLDISKLDPVVARKTTDVLARGRERVAVDRVEDRIVPGPDGEIPVRVYTPEESAPVPALVYFHGGGFVYCSIETHDVLCRQLARDAGCAVISVEYRRAPEHTYPAAPEDCYAATRWVAERAAEIGVDPARIAVGGDSVGGNLAAVVALMARDRGGPGLRQQLLIYPVTNHAFDTASYRENAEGLLLTRQMMQTFWGYYLERESDGGDAYASPLRAPNLSGLPRAYVVTAEFDPLRDEGAAYAERLRRAGVAVTHAHYSGMIHGFFDMFETIDRSRDACAEAVEALRSGFGSDG